MINERNIQIKSPNGRPILIDVFAPDDDRRKPVIIFSHGFKGFKDWGYWNVFGEAFARGGFVFVKFNFSHNGVGTERLSEFTDLEAFGANTLTMELDDLGAVIDWTLEPEQQHRFHIDVDELVLMGHSRGGGTTILKAREDERVKRLITLAALRSFERYSQGDIEKWHADGVIYVENVRTNQSMPLNWSLVQDYLDNKSRLDIEEALAHIPQPFLIVHGTNDETVAYADGLHIYENSHSSQLATVIGGDHSFGGKEPWTSDKLPDQAQTMLTYCLEFLRAQE